MYIKKRNSLFGSVMNSSRYHALNMKESKPKRIIFHSPPAKRVERNKKGTLWGQNPTWHSLNPYVMIKRHGVIETSLLLETPRVRKTQPDHLNPTTSKWRMGCRKLRKWG